MLNLKKGLALVLAAATAFTFAPVASLDAFANTNFSKDQAANNDQVTVSGSVSYSWTGATQISDTLTGAVDYVDDAHQYVNATLSGNKIIIDGLKGSDGKNVTVNVKNGNNIVGSVTLKVVPKNTVPTLKVGTAVLDPIKSDSQTVNINDTQTGVVALIADDARPTVDKLEKVNGDSVTVSGTQITAVDPTKGDTTVRIYTTNGAENQYLGKNHTYIVNFHAVKSTSTFTVEGKKVGEDANVNTTGSVVKTTEVTQSANTYQIAASLDNKQSGEAVTYHIYNSEATADAANTTTTQAASNEATVSDKGLVTVKAAGFDRNAAYFVRVDDKADMSGRFALVSIVPSRTAKSMSSVAITIDGKTTKAAAEYNKDATIKNGSANASVALSTKDRTSITLNPSPATASITSNDPSVVAVNGTTLEAKKAGIATVTIKVDSSATTYGAAQINLSVTVSDKYANNPITASDVVLTNNAPKQTISAKAAYDNTLVYEFVKQDDKGNWVADNSQNNLTLNKTTGVVEYKKNGTTGEAHVQITGSANDKAEAPIAKVISVKYQPEKEDSNLTVSTPALSLKAGETGDIKAAATGASISYVSYAPEVATVDAATGKVTAVSKGTAVVAVNAAETDTMKAGQKLVYVTVDNGTIAAPAKVAGLKVTNAKGAKVNVSWTSQGKNIQYRVYKKVGNGKWVAKNVTKGKASLSVKKGAKVQVKVKAFVKDQNGKTVWGPKATKKTFKTDNK